MQWNVVLLKIAQGECEIVCETVVFCFLFFLV